MSRARTLWDDDRAQFARLLAEINAIDLTIAQHQQLCENMDIEPHELNELFERAHERYEATKRRLPPARLGHREVFVVLDGSLSDGYRAHGPYPDFDTASHAHPGLSWILAATLPTTQGTAIALTGNLSDGLELEGIHEDLTAAAEATDGVEAWLMTLHPPQLQEAT